MEKKKRYKVREKSPAWALQQNWKPITLLMMMSALLGIMAACSEAEPIEPVEPIVLMKEEIAEEVIYIEQAEFFPLSDEERDLVERVVAAEARGESIECQMAVAQTIKDRCLTREQTPTEVCTAPYQFAAPYQGEISDKVKDAVRFTFDHGDNVLDYPTTHFYAWKLIDPPYWTESKDFRGEIGGVRFYGDKDGE